MTEYDSNLLTVKRIKKDLSLKVGGEVLAYSGALLLWELILAVVSFALCQIFDTKIVFFSLLIPIPYYLYKSREWIVKLFIIRKEKFIVRNAILGRVAPTEYERALFLSVATLFGRYGYRRMYHPNRRVSSLYFSEYGRYVATLTDGDIIKNAREGDAFYVVLYIEEGEVSCAYNYNEFDGIQKGVLSDEANQTDIDR